MKTSYLRCNTCGHHNEIKTEHLTFCSNCKKKLDNNFFDWHQRNSNKSYHDFKQSVCTPDRQPVIENIQPKFKVSKTLKILFGAILGVAFYFSLKYYTEESIVRYIQSITYDTVMMTAASEINKSCPIMIDSETRLDNAISLPNNVFQYNYTLINMLKKNIDIKSIKNQLEPSVINFVKTNPDMEIQRNNKTTINYYYKDKSGVYLFTISVSPDKYL